MGFACSDNPTANETRWSNTGNAGNAGWMLPCTTYHELNSDGKALAFTRADGRGG